MQDEQLGAARLLSQRAESIPDGWITPGLKEIPYDYIASFILTGTRGRRSEDVINISVDGAFIATSIGYSFVPAKPTNAPVLFNFADVDQVLTGLFGDPRLGERALAAKVFGVDFLYSIVDSGTGRELQNRLNHNVAGLGSADGRRPFRPMAKPMLFQPRSTVRVVIEEISTGPLYEQAQLFLVFHGYKILGVEY